VGVDWDHKWSAAGSVSLVAAFALPSAAKRIKITVFRHDHADAAIVHLRESALAFPTVAAAIDERVLRQVNT
jgi:hypothetical protein